MTTRPGVLARAAILAGLAGGAADILTAFVIYRPAPPMRILQAVGSGLLGAASFEGGMGSAAVGLIAHFAIAVIFAAIFIAAALQAPVAFRKPVLSGLLYGIVVYGVMNAIVVPLSMAAERTTPPDQMTAVGLMAHAFFGVALSLVATRMLRNQAP